MGLVTLGSTVSTVFAQAVPPVLTPIPPPLSVVAIPRPDLTGIVTPGSEGKLVALGKALFWDQQVGGDGIMSCASCHYHAGADHRQKNQVNAGANGVFETVGKKGQLTTAKMFPFGWATNTPKKDDVIGSQGTQSGDFREINPNSPVDAAVFGKIIGHRQVTGRNSPTNINAVFNFRNFWDGRAAESFNGVTPFGSMDQGAKLIIDSNGAVAGGFATEKINLPFSSLASQAVGPPNNDVEMSFKGRDWADLGFKMLTRKPLGLQTVPAGANGDSVLGSFANTVGNPPKGLTFANYELMMDGIFNPKYVTADFRVCFGTNGYQPKPVGNCPTGKLDGYTVAQANFSLFFGLAVQAYQQTLVSDKSKFDTWARTFLDTGVLAPNNVLTAQEFNGLLTFYGPKAQCGVCHFGPEFTSASVSFLNLLQAGGAVDGGPFPVNKLNVGVFDANALRTTPQLPPADGGTLVNNPACNGIGCVYAQLGSALGTTYPTQNPLLGPDKRFIGPYERMTMAYRKDSTGKTMIINPLNVFNLPDAQNPLSVGNLPAGVLPAGGNTAPDPAFTAVGTAPVNQRTQSPFAIYDLGFYNIGPRPTAEDLAVGGVMPPNVQGTAPFPGAGATGTANVPLSMTRRMKANQASLSKFGWEDRDYWAQPSSFSAFPFNTCVIQENQALIPGLAVVPGVTAFPGSPNLVDPQGCNFFGPVGPGLTAEFQAVLDPLTLQPMLGGRMLNGADYQQAEGNIAGTAIATPDTSCSGTTNYGPSGATTGTPNQCPEERDAVDGAFKTPGLRNVEFTGPYFHNGSAKSLAEAVDFYATGGHHVNMELSPEILAIPANALTATEKADLVAFLLTLSDDRVAYQKAPFDHPSLCLVESNASAYDDYKLLPAVGAGGTTARLETYVAMLATSDKRLTCKPY